MRPPTTVITAAVWRSSGGGRGKISRSKTVKSATRPGATRPSSRRPAAKATPAVAAVQFVIKTGDIKLPEAEAPVQAEEPEETFWQRVQDLFPSRKSK